MSCLLVLGSKPSPNIPLNSTYDDVACANASGYSADQCGLKRPKFTVMSSCITSGMSRVEQKSYNAIQGLETDTLYFVPSVTKNDKYTLTKLARYFWTIRRQPLFAKIRLWMVNYGYKKFVTKKKSKYIETIKKTCKNDKKVVEAIENKKPSTGITALCIGIYSGRYEKYIMSGFSLETEKEYFEDTSQKKYMHESTDIRILKNLKKRFDIRTTEPKLNEKTNIDMVSGE